MEPDEFYIDFEELTYKELLKTKIMKYMGKLFRIAEKSEELNEFIYYASYNKAVKAKHADETLSAVSWQLGNLIYQIGNVPVMNAEPWCMHLHDFIKLYLKGKNKRKIYLFKDTHGMWCVEFHEVAAKSKHNLNYIKTTDQLISAAKENAEMLIERAKVDAEDKEIMNEYRCS